MFVDAPYKSGAGQIAALTIQSLGGLAPNAIIVLETHKSETIDHTQLGSASMTLDITRTYGNVALHFITHKI